MPSSSSSAKRKSHKSNPNSDFQAKRTKLGQKQTPSNATSTAFKAKSIALPNQRAINQGNLLAVAAHHHHHHHHHHHDEPPPPPSRRRKSIHELVALLRHYSPGVRKDSLQALDDTLARQPELLRPTLAILLPNLVRLAIDEDAGVRRQLHSLLARHHLDPHRLPPPVLAPYRANLVLYVATGMSHIYLDVRVDCAKLAHLVLLSVASHTQGGTRSVRGEDLNAAAGLVHGWADVVLPAHHHAAAALAPSSSSSSSTSRHGESLLRCHLTLLLGAAAAASGFARGDAAATTTASHATASASVAANELSTGSRRVVLESLERFLDLTLLVTAPTPSSSSSARADYSTVIPGLSNDDRDQDDDDDDVAELVDWFLLPSFADAAEGRAFLDSLRPWRARASSSRTHVGFDAVATAEGGAAGVGASSRDVREVVVDFGGANHYDHGIGSHHAVDGGLVDVEETAGDVVSDGALLGSLSACLSYAPRRVSAAATNDATTTTTTTAPPSRNAALAYLHLFQRLSACLVASWLDAAPAAFGPDAAATTTTSAAAAARVGADGADESARVCCAVVAVARCVWRGAMRGLHGGRRGRRGGRRREGGAGAGGRGAKAGGAGASHVADGDDEEDEEDEAEDDEEQEDVELDVAAERALASLEKLLAQLDAYFPFGGGGAESAGGSRWGTTAGAGGSSSSAATAAAARLLRLNLDVCELSAMRHQCLLRRRRQGGRRRDDATRAPPDGVGRSGGEGGGGGSREAATAAATAWGISTPSSSSDKAARRAAAKARARAREVRRSRARMARVGSYVCGLLVGEGDGSTGRGGWRGDEAEEVRIGGGVFGPRRRGRGDDGGESSSSSCEDEEEDDEGDEGEEEDEALARTDSFDWSRDDVVEAEASAARRARERGVAGRIVAGDGAGGGGSTLSRDDYARVLPVVWLLLNEAATDVAADDDEEEETETATRTTVTRHRRRLRLLVCVLEHWRRLRVAAAAAARRRRRGAHSETKRLATAFLATLVMLPSCPAYLGNFRPFSISASAPSHAAAPPSQRTPSSQGRPPNRMRRWQRRCERLRELEAGALRLWSQLLPRHLFELGARDERGTELVLEVLRSGVVSLGGGVARAGEGVESSKPAATRAWRGGRRGNEGTWLLGEDVESRLAPQLAPFFYVLQPVVRAGVYSRLSPEVRARARALLYYLVHLAPPHPTSSSSPSEPPTSEAARDGPTAQRMPREVTHPRDPASGVPTLVNDEGDKGRLSRWPPQMESLLRAARMAGALQSD